MSTNNVLIYGTIGKIDSGILIFKLGNKIANSWAAPKNKHAPKTPYGFHFPKITATNAIKPCPETKDCEKFYTVAKLIVAPPKPANNPDIITAKYLYK